MASGADRISDLPEDVLHHILSLLPARDAVLTVRFAPFVDGLLRVRRGGPRLRSCDFDLDVVDLDPCRFDLELHGNSWIRRVLQLNVREFRFRVSSNLSRRPFELDDTPLSSQHLTSLELTGVDGIDLDFSGCPALHSLKMEASHVRSLEMRSPSLKHLSIKYCCFYPECRTEMSFPSLVSFEFITNSGRAPILERMPYLETAKVRFDHDHVCDDRCINGRLEDCGDDDCCCCFYYHGHHDSGSGSVFLQGLAEATYLNLSAYPDMYVFNRDLKWCPAFNKLKTLVLSKWFLSTDFSPLIWIRHHSPLLEKLTLEIPKEHKSLMETEGSYNPWEKLIAPSHLQIVEIICKDVDGIVLKVFKLSIRVTKPSVIGNQVLILCVLISTPSRSEKCQAVDDSSRLLKQSDTKTTIRVYNSVCFSL
ncbi:unnamed protein product [Miscanthus lutarioriparius]|uniref:F-box domain-containing protein n=1 Tax=Miscanthus lutarioriparius TaxID=422564 RepID=A0A811QPS7_9POAL|nr:unnamed protein product [Miscanthus lutarioriparius]